MNLAARIRRAASFQPQPTAFAAIATSQERSVIFQLAINRVAVEKLTLSKFAEISSR
jgi:hypothetical protein